MSIEWKHVPLGEVCRFQGGSQPPKSTFIYEPKSGYVRLIQIRDYKSDKHIVYIPKDKAKRFCKKDDVMIGRYGPPVFQILRGIEGAYNVALMKAIPDEKVLSKDYLFNFLKSPGIQDYIIKLSSRAAGQSGLNKATIEPYPILLPPISEQKRIVAILDEAFAGIDTAIANTEKNLANARELFESYLNAVLTQDGDGWEKKLLGEVCVLQRGFDLPKRLRTNGEFPLVSSSGIIDSHIEAKVKAPGVATGRSGSIGNVFFIEDDFWPLNTVLYVKEFFGNDPQFVFYLLKNFDLNRFASGAGVPTLNRNHVHGEVVHVPTSIEVQRNIVENFNSLSDEIKRLESIYQQKLNSLKELKQSLLQKAFSGELTAEADNHKEEAVA